MSRQLGDAHDAIGDAPKQSARRATAKLGTQAHLPDAVLVRQRTGDQRWHQLGARQRPQAGNREVVPEFVQIGRTSTVDPALIQSRDVADEYRGAGRS